MIGTSYHVQIDGVKYQVNQVSETPHTETGGPLRSPTAQVVQGENDEFNLRQDVLRFQWSDWSGGMGQNKYSRENPNMYFDGLSIDGFTKPGVLRAGLHAQRAQDSTGAADFTFTSAANLPWLAGANPFRFLYIGTNSYKWDFINKKWGAAQAITGATGKIHAAVHYNTYQWLVDDNSIIRQDSTGTSFTDWVTGLSMSAVNSVKIAALGGKLYVLEIDELGLTVTEYPTTGTAPVTGTVVFQDATIKESGAAQLVQTHNRLYFVTNNDVFYTTTLWEVVPSTSAAAGYAFQKFSMPMFTTALWHHSGVIYFFGQGRYGDPINLDDYVSPQIRYYSPAAGTYGILANLDPLDTQATDPQYSVNGPAEHPLGIMFSWVRDNYWTVGWADVVKGAVHPYAYVPITSGVAGNRGISIATGWDGELLTFQGGAASPQYVFFLEPDVFEGAAVSPYCLSSQFNFDIGDDKVLSSILVDMLEAVPANWRVDVSYMLDDDPNWTTAGSLVAGETTKKITVSSFASTKTFTAMRLVIQFVWLGAGDPTTTPEVQYVEARAQIPGKVRTWDLELDLSDDASDVDGVMQTGQAKADNIRNLGQSGSVVLFRDGMTSSQADDYDSYNVVVDSYVIAFAKPGEGTARVRLVEVA